MKTAFFQTCLGVFQGGGCRAAAFAGAYAEAAARGVHFAEVAGTSAGAIVAALVGAGATPEQLERLVAELDFTALLVPPDVPARPLRSPVWLRAFFRFLAATPLGSYTPFFSHLGLHSSRGIEEWMNRRLCELVGGGVRRVKFSDLVLPTWIVATDLKTRDAKIWSNSRTPHDDVASAVRASCSIPFFFQPAESRYIDGGALSNLPTFVYTLPGATDRPLSSRILAFALDEDIESDADSQSPVDLVRSVLNAVVDGGRDLQATIQRNVHRISIPTGRVRATDFGKMTPEIVTSLAANGRAATASFFDSELQRVRAVQVGSNTLEDVEEIYSAVTETLQYAAREVIISEKDTDWVYPLFPTLLCWLSSGVRVRAQVQSSAQGQKDLYRRRLLRALGVELSEPNQIFLSAYIVDPDDSDASSAIVDIPYSGHYSRSRRATRYFGRADFRAIQCIRDQALAGWAPKGESQCVPTIERVSEEDVLRRLAMVRQYGHPSVSMAYQNVKLASLISLTRFVREFKTRQISPFIDLLTKNNLDLFAPSAVRLADGGLSVIGPPVLEKSGSDYILIEGTTRAVYCRDHGIDEIRCVVVDGVREPLPSREMLPIGRVRMSGRHIPIGDRYDGFNHTHFRHIEESLRPLDSL